MAEDKTGTATEQTPEEVQEPTQVEQAQEDREAKEPDEPKEKTFTQAEVDDIVKRRLEREKKATEKAEDTEGLKAMQERLDMLEQANRQKEAENYALRKGVDPDRLAYATKLAQTIGADSPEEAIDQVLADFPFLVKQEEEAAEDGRGVIKASVKKAAPKAPTMTKREILDIRDPVERRKAIRENPTLFTNLKG